jgi:LysR family transcriptional activator of nhaA
VLNFRHLHYFWIVAQEGGFSRAADRLGVAVQTVSAQVRALEQDLGCALLKPVRTGVALTEAGEAAFTRAEEIFRLGELVPDEVRAAVSGVTARLAVGMSDGLSKLAAHALLAPVLGTPSLHLVCHDGEVEELLAELAMHRLDVVLACRPPPPNPGLRLTSERIAVSPIEWYGPARWLDEAGERPFPQCLDALPVLLPTGHSALRPRLERWFEAHGLRPRVVGEFEDSALLAVFAARGLGVFPVSRLGGGDVTLMPGLGLLGRSDEVAEEIHAIRSRRGQHHPLVARIVESARRLETPS